MAAGDRAAEQSRLAAERVARLRRELEQAERHSQAWSAGAAGEATVAAKMSELAASGWLALHDVHWPGRPKANLDHILVGPGGIVVVDAKNWSGNVQVSDGRLRQNGYRRDREVLGASQQSAAVAALLEPQHRRFAQGWICLVAQPAVDETTDSGVRILGLDALCPAAAHLPPVLDATEVQVIHAHLNEQLTGPASPPLLTTAEFAGADAPAAALQQWRTAAPGRSQHGYAAAPISTAIQATKLPESADSVGVAVRRRIYADELRGQLSTCCPANTRPCSDREPDNTGAIAARSCRSDESWQTCQHDCTSGRLRRSGH